MFFPQTEDYLKRKIRSRPERSELVRMHILEGVLDRKCFFMQTLLLTVFTLHHPRFFFMLSRCPHSSQRRGMQSSPPDLSLACIYFHSLIHLIFTPAPVKYKRGHPRQTLPAPAHTLLSSF